MKLKALTAAVLAAALLSACGSSAASSAAPAADTSSETAASADNSGDLLAQIQQRGEIVFGTEGTWSPWTYHDENDQLVGFDIEVAQKVAEKLGVKATFVEGEWDGLLAGVIAVLVFWMERCLAPFCMNGVEFQFIASFCCGISTLLFCRIGPQLHADKILIGIIMLVLGSLSALGYGPLARFTVFGMQFLDFFDFLTNSVMMPIAAITTCLLVSRVIGVKKIEEEVTQEGQPFRRKPVFNFMLRYLCPIFAAIILASSVANALGWIAM